MKADGFLETIRDWCNDKFLRSIPIATKEILGGIKPDGTSIIVNSDGIAKAVCSGGAGSNYSILSTLSSVEQNTESGSLVDALVIKEVFQSVSEGKRIIALAITDRGVDTNAEDKFVQIAKNIGLIQGRIPIKQKSNISMIVKEGNANIMPRTKIDANLSPLISPCTKANISLKEG